MRRLLTALFLWVLRSTAWAEQRPVLHEPLQVPQLRCSGGICRRDGTRDDLPEAVEAQDGLVSAPPPAPAGTDEPVYTPGPPGGAVAPPGAPRPGVDPPPIRRASVGPDRSTGKEPPGERLYHEVFNPAVLPFKRMTALDAVAEDETLYQRAPQLVPLPTAAHPSPGRDPFYGSLVVDFPTRAPVPIPSPAAGVRLLSYRAEPAAALLFYRDGADNLYVSAASAGLRRITYLVDAEQRYFAGPLPAGLHAGHLPPGLLPRLPPGVQHRADAVLRHIGVNRKGDYRQQLEALVSYFRAFRLEELRDHRGSTYLDLALEQRGVCRHRVYAFVITAIGAGIAARYVENELHVFAEVYVPIPGGGYWRRVNLGGAPLEQLYLDTAGKEAYRDKGGDPFPQPEAYRAAQPQHARGLPQQAGGQRGAGAGGRGEGGAQDERSGRQAGDLARSGGTSGRPGDERGGDPVRSGGAGERPGDTGGGDPARPGRSGSGAAKGPRDPAHPGSESEGATHGPGGGPNGRGGGPDGPGGGPNGRGGGPDGEHGTSASGSSGAGPAGGDDPGGDGAQDGAGSVPLPPDDPVAGLSDTRRDPPAAPLVPTAVSLSMSAEASRSVYRGAALRIHGRVQVRSGSPEGLEVYLLLDTGAGLVPLGHTAAGPDGTYRAEVEVPTSAPLGKHRLVARVRGDDSRRGSASSHQ